MLVSVRILPVFLPLQGCVLCAAEVSSAVLGCHGDCSQRHNEMMNQSVSRELPVCTRPPPRHLPQHVLVT